VRESHERRKARQRRSFPPILSAPWRHTKTAASTTREGMTQPRVRGMISIWLPVSAPVTHEERHRIRWQHHIIVCCTCIARIPLAIASSKDHYHLYVLQLIQSVLLCTLLQLQITLFPPTPMWLSNQTK
jgi:hypothetical protein